MACGLHAGERRHNVKSSLCKAVAALIVIAGLAGCATSPQEPWFDHLDYLLWLNAAD
jgi:hypothetical protein